MMIEPGITMLDKCVDSRYTLVSMAAKRARMVGTEQAHEKEGKDPKELKDVYFDKPVTVAVQEIASGKVGYVRSESLKKAELYEKEKYEALSNYVENEGNNSSESEESEDGVVYGENIVEHEFYDD
jgi:DNA-directed RNA polymerase subunit omega